jgi:hypothetical protein
MTTTHTTRLLHTRMKNDMDKDNSLLPLCRQDTKKGKEQEEKPHLYLLSSVSSSSMASSSSFS